jgi:hypothetical protein
MTNDSYNIKSGIKKMSCLKDKSFKRTGIFSYRDSIPSCDGGGNYLIPPGRKGFQRPGI